MMRGEAEFGGQFNYIIVGGGTAGCVLASRLSEDASLRVLLIEAGSDVKPDEEPEDVLSVHAKSSFNPSYRWPIPAYFSDHLQREPAMQARVLGGGSSVMGMLSLRGVPDDYDGWAAQGAAGWSWQDVLPWFRKLETDVDFSGELHGSSGPVHISRNPKNTWPPLCRAFEEYACRSGNRYVEDMNASFVTGLASLPLALRQGRRQSSSICYLTAEVRRRSNLRIMTNTEVTGLSRKDSAFDGVYARTDCLVHFGADEIILSAGAILSPALLMRAGIGPSAELQRHGIQPLVERRSVGAGLKNHPMLFLAAFLPRKAREPEWDRSLVNCCLRYSSDGGNRESDMYILAMNKTAPSPLGGALGALQSYLLKPKSTGTIELQGANSLQPPVARFNLFSHEEDLARAVKGLRDMAAMATSPEFQALGAAFFAVRFSDRLRSLNQPRLANRLISHASLAMLNLVPGSAAFFKRMIPGGPTAHELSVMGDEELGRLARDYVNPSGHHVGTCRMGAPADPDAVVDPEGRVIGVQGLRVVDASIMPDIPRGNTNLPTLMIAEKLADNIRHGS